MPWRVSLKVMKENIITECDTCTDKLDKCSYEKLVELIKRLVLDHRKHSGVWFCPNHNLEIYLYEFWAK
jgi:hypothetical protein